MPSSNISERTETGRPVASLLPEQFAPWPGVDGKTHAEILFRAAHSRLTPHQETRYSRLLERNRSALQRRSTAVHRSYRDRGGNVKLRVRLSDGASIETVVLTDRPPGVPGARRTLCVSTQVGCAMGCRFCRTGELGLRRNLSTAEIVEQYLHARERYGAITNLVFMGMGEPLLNEKAVYAAVRVFAHPLGPEIPFKRITVSTCGIPGGIRRLARAPFLETHRGARPRLAVSLVTARPELRAELMPGATRQAACGPVAESARRGFAELETAIAAYLSETGRPVTLEVPLLGGVNDRAEDARALTAFLDRLPRPDRLDVNLIPWNPVAGLPFDSPRPEDVEQFAAEILRGGYPVTGRYPRGRTIGAACGQLGEV